MNRLAILITVIIILSAYLVPQSKIKVMSYNLLNYPGMDTTIRNPYFRTVINSVQPDILVAQEILSKSGLDGFLKNVMNSSGNIYSAGSYIEDPNNDIAVFYKTKEFTFINVTTIYTNQKNISEFRIKYNSSEDTLILFSLHLKPGPGSSIEADRGKEIDSLRKVTDKLPLSANFLVIGDFNTNGSNEPYYHKLLDQSKSGYSIDPIFMTGIWNSAANSIYHTRSTRIRSFGGGLPGGLSYRSDMILYSKSVSEQAGITYVPGSYTVYGNDGNHFNDSINMLLNTAVSLDMANALYYASDHLPVLVTLKFNKVVNVEKEKINNIAKGFYLYQNYPNPFNPSTNIKYEIPQNSMVKISVFDLLGKEIETLINEEQPSGKYELIYNAGNLPSGIYFYCLRSGNYIAVKKMILLR